MIGPELVITHPMTSTYGYVTYLNYEFGVTKGGIKQNDYYNGPFALGDVDETYTSDRVAETVEAYADADNSNAITISLAWTPIIEGQFTCKVNGTEVEGALSKDRAHITFASGVAAGDDVQVAYLYDNIVIPQSTLPTLKARFDKIALEAHARRIAIYYSQIAMFQAKTDYGVDLAEQLAEQAVGELVYRFCSLAA